MFVNVPLRMGDKKRTGCLCFKSFVTYFGSSILPVSFYFFRIFRRISLFDFCRLSRLCGKKRPRTVAGVALRFRDLRPNEMEITSL